MSLVVFTGGARSGKSRAAQALAVERSRDGRRVIVAVFGRTSDDEMAERIERHRAERPRGFETRAVDDPLRWVHELVSPPTAAWGATEPAADGSDVRDGDVLVIDCLGTLVGRVMEQAWDRLGTGNLAQAGETLPGSVRDSVEEGVADLLDRLLQRHGDTIIVTNEVGDGLVPPYASGRLFRDVLGAANRRLVDAADVAYLCVAGRLFDLSVLPKRARWPED